MAVTSARSKLRAMVTEPPRRYSAMPKRLRALTVSATLTLFALMLLGVFLAPLAYMTSTALKDSTQISDTHQPLLPESPREVAIGGEQVPVMQVPIDGHVRELALVEKGRTESVLADPAHPEQRITWKGSWRTLKPAYEFKPQWGNFSTVWTAMDIPVLLRNTIAIGALGAVGSVISSTLVAYGLSRFRVPFAPFILASLVASIILPRFLTVVPTYAVWQHLGFVGTWVPLIAPHFFANAYNVFLLRQFFLSIPRELDDAAAIDGAGTLKTLWYIIIPQARPAIFTVAVLHFLFAWNDFFEPLIYLTGKPDLMPFSVGLFQFLGLYSVQIPLLQAGALLGMVLPILLFLFGQRIFLRGLDLSGSGK
ncbi:carbohydrate ABC transporter permease [Streptomyces adelaidensis]|uniref:carbohydrate ABC transporter permease n=1 Tax=Streptomyces adelaidensis TaxID=2796465 RepID=UPI00190435C1|nr:carbohydrate ABC transporter permease [Streptomyces adelaidensis]